MTKTKNIMMILAVLMLIISFTPMDAFADETSENSIEKLKFQPVYDENGNFAGVSTGVEKSSNEVWNNVFTKYKDFILGVSGLATLTAILMFIVRFMQLQINSGNPTAKAQSLQALLWTGLATAGLGSVTTIVGYFYYIL